VTSRSRSSLLRLVVCSICTLISSCSSRRRSSHPTGRQKLFVRLRFSRKQSTVETALLSVHFLKWKRTGSRTEDMPARSHFGCSYWCGLPLATESVRHNFWLLGELAICILGTRHEVPLQSKEARSIAEGSFVFEPAVCRTAILYKFQQVHPLGVHSWTDVFGASHLANIRRARTSSGQIRSVLSSALAHKES
jgi:hypothetical protein